jgi:pimeloyl-ACP methyl ester carboxylesterase
MQMVAGSVSHRVSLRGIDFHYLEWGDASRPPLVLLHGLTGHAHIWDHMAPHLAERYRVLVPDQRGHGDTSHPDSYTTQEFADDVEALRAHWGIERFTLVGLSMGGHNSIAYASQHPERVERLIIIDIPPAFDMGKSPDYAKIEAQAKHGHRRFATFEEAYAEARLSNTTAPDESLRYRTMCNVRDAGDGTLSFKYDHRVQATWRPEDLWSAIPRVTMPALLVRGGLTTVLPRATAEKMVATFPALELVEIPDSGHSVPTDKPEKLWPIVLDWLDRASAKPAR